MTFNPGKKLYISDVTLPKGVSLVIADRDFTVATIIAPAGGVDETAVEAGEGEAEA